MKIKRTIPSIEAKLRSHSQKCSSSLPRRQFDGGSKLVHQNNHISIVDEVEKKEDEELAKKYLTKKPTIFKKEYPEMQILSSAKHWNIQNRPCNLKQQKSVDKCMFEQRTVETIASENSSFKFNKKLRGLNGGQLSDQKKSSSNDKNRNEDKKYERSRSLKKKISNLEQSIKSLEKQLPSTLYLDERRNFQNTSSAKLASLQLERKKRCNQLERQNALLLQKLQPFSRIQQKQRVKYIN